MERHITPYERGRLSTLNLDLRLDGKPCGDTYIAIGYECRGGSATGRTVKSALKLAGQSVKKAGSRAIAAVKNGRQGTSRKTEEELEALFEEVTGNKPPKLNRNRSAKAVRRAKSSAMRAIEASERLTRRT